MLFSWNSSLNAMSSNDRDAHAPRESTAERLFRPVYNAWVAVSPPALSATPYLLWAGAGLSKVSPYPCL